jgi:hypothetical protein
VTEEDGRGKAFQIEGTAYVEPVDRVLIARITRGSVSGWSPVDETKVVGSTKH